MKDIIKVLVLMALLAIAVLQSGYHSNGQSNSSAVAKFTVANDFYQTRPDTEIELAVLNNDQVDDYNSTVVFEQPVYGTIYSKADGNAFYYKPKKGFKGQDRFVYRVCLNNACQSAAVAIKITAPN